MRSPVLHPVQSRVDRAAWWRAHLIERCRLNGLPEVNRRVTVGEIVRATARYYGVGVDDIVGPRRSREYVYPRQVAMFLSYRMTDRSLPEIGRRIGDRDHTTVIWGVKQVTERISSDHEVRNAVSIITSMIEEAVP